MLSFHRFAYAAMRPHADERTFGRASNYPYDVNLNLNVFWTLVVLVIGTPVLTLGLLFLGLLAATMLGYNSERF